MQMTSCLGLAAMLWSSANLVAEVPACESPKNAAKFTISTETQVAGGVLQTGQYPTRVVDHLLDRVTMRIDNIIRYVDGRTIELDESFGSGGFQYETEHFCDLLSTGRTESPRMIYEMLRQIMRILDHARADIRLLCPQER